MQRKRNSRSLLNTTPKYQQKNQAGKFDRGMKDAILARDNHTCAYCGFPAFQVDHVIPKSRGGPAIRANGVAVCVLCNMQKKNRVDIERITRGLFVLAVAGEDTSWVDSLVLRW